MTRALILINASNLCIRQAAHAIAHAVHLSNFEFAHAVTGHDSKRREVAADCCNALALSDGYQLKSAQLLAAV